ncbi:MAG: DUF7064 domain-containing protein [Acidimicrobiia bacterium]
MGVVADVIEYDERSERPHDSDGTPSWQESVALAWGDGDAGIGGFVRIGHEPHYDGGIAVVTGGVVTRTGTAFRRNAVDRLSDENRLETGFGAREGTYRVTYEDGLRYTAVDGPLRLDLRVSDYYGRTDFFPEDAGSLVDEFAASHFETSGQITGWVELDGTTFEVNGMCHRDHSWGTRKWDTILSHRWCPITFGPDLSIGNIVWHSADGAIRDFGYVVRGGKVTYASAVEVVVEMEADGVSFRGGTVTVTLPDGERLAVDVRTMDAIVNDHHGVVWLAGIGEAELDGRIGFCDLEVSNNARAGTQPVTTTMRALKDDGLRVCEPSRGSAERASLLS